MRKPTTCACMAVVEMPRKRDVIRVIALLGYERHGRSWCAKIVRGLQQVDGELGNSRTGWTIPPRWTQFIRLD